MGDRLTVLSVSYSEGEGFVLVYSITARATFDRIERFRHQISRVKDTDDIPMVLVGNKSDRQNEREVSKEDGQQLAKRLNCQFIETSAKTRANLEDAYYNVVRQSKSPRSRQRVRLELGRLANPPLCWSVRKQNEGITGVKPVKKQKKSRKCTIL